LVNDKVLYGKWSEPYSDGTEPWQWKGSQPIFQEFLQTGRRTKYGQCWVYAGVFVSALRSMGMASLVVTNFNSAHGRPPYNKGIDDFFFYDEFMQPTPHVNSQESVWNFHVWNQVFMRRPDLPETGSEVDGWQVVDATPQEQTCEMRGGQEFCRYALGPTPVKAVYDNIVDTHGRETQFNSVNAGLSYDGMFAFTEARGEMRGWLPDQLNFKECKLPCYPKYRGDGYCDEECNRPECDYDMGDCCQEGCNQVINGLYLIRKYECGSNGYVCRGKGRGWKQYYNNTNHIGRELSTTLAGGQWFEKKLLTDDYKPPTRTR